MWKKDNRYIGIYYQTKVFNGDKYLLSIITEETGKSIKFYVELSSGRKRKHLDILEAKEEKSKGGIKALIWAKNEILTFPSFYNSRYRNTKPTYICIGWADERRRKIYSRLLKEGFYFGVIGRSKCLIKKIED